MTSAAREVARIDLGSRSRSAGLAALAASEVGSGLLGFSATVHLARRLGPSPFARLEFAGAVAAWLLVIVRGGIEQVVWREAARHPRRIADLSDLLLGIKLALAAVGYLAALAIAASAGGESGRLIAVAALILPASAISVDVGPRALAKFGPVAIGQALRAVGLAISAALLVAGPGDLIPAAWCAVGAELIGGLVPTCWQGRRFGWPRPRFRGRAWLVLGRRGALASLTRFGRVSLFGLDILVLGWIGSADLGPYSASRRLVFAAVALGLVVPNVFAPAIAAGFAGGGRQASRIVREAHRLLWTIAAPVAIVLGLSGDLTLKSIFGASYRSSGPWLALIGARLPWILSTSLGQTALVACRAEGRALVVIASMASAAILVLPVAGSRWGALGAGWALLAIEAAGAFGMAWMLGRIGVRAIENLSDPQSRERTS